MQAPRLIVRSRPAVGGSASVWNGATGTFDPIDIGSRATTLAANRASLAAGRAAGLRASAARAAPRETEDDSGYDGGAADYDPGGEPAENSALPAYSNWDLHPLLWRSDDGNEAHFLVSEAPAARCSKWRYSYVALRMLRFTDGQLLTGWCSDLGCASCQAASAIAEGCTSLPHPRSWYSVSMCDRCQRMVRGVGGEAGLTRLLALPRPQSSSPEGMFSRRLVLKPGKVVTAVKAGEGLDSWGVLEKGRCNSCRSNPCQHTAVRRTQQQRLSEAAWERRFLAEWDMEGGKRKLTCISRAKLEEKVENSPSLLRIYTRAHHISCMKLAPSLSTC